MSAIKQDQIARCPPYSVKYQIYAGRDHAAPGTHWIRDLASLEDCQRAYIDAREASALGASQFGDGEIYDREKLHAARLSYNGRLWPPVPWSADLEPLAEPPRTPSAVVRVAYETQQFFEIDLPEGQDPETYCDTDEARAHFADLITSRFIDLKLERAFDEDGKETEGR
ncbi:hypothetical protein [uncultured Tateyamaria sp.]|uniref:hypothetical protein n=1 Tax=uncultured Tateyamaria sp. TaxID=455651 RepID=UPI00262FEAF8|nr:hypothetical protein [uncultured Tateyamaria sp.]